MKKIIALLTVLSSVFFSAGATAQNQPLACQSDASAGLSWENGRWVVTRTVDKKFILVNTKNGLTLESVKKALGMAVTMHCEFFDQRTSCSNLSGRHLLFDSRSLKGGYSVLFGTTQADDDAKDTPYLIAFSCTPF